MIRKAWLHMGGLLPTATPVEVLSKGPKRAHVRLVHRLRWNREWFAAGSTRYVPSEALGNYPGHGYLVSVGRGRFVPQGSPAAEKAISRSALGEDKTDKALRSRISAERKAGRIGVK